MSIVKTALQSIAILTIASSAIISTGTASAKNAPENNRLYETTIQDKQHIKQDTTIYSINKKTTAMTTANGKKKAFTLKKGDTINAINLSPNDVTKYKTVKITDPRSKKTGYVQASVIQVDRYALWANIKEDMAQYKLTTAAKKVKVKSIPTYTIPKGVFNEKTSFEKQTQKDFTPAKQFKLIKKGTVMEHRGRYTVTSMALDTPKFNFLNPTKPSKHVKTSVYTLVQTGHDAFTLVAKDSYVNNKNATDVKDLDVYNGLTGVTSQNSTAVIKSPKKLRLQATTREGFLAKEPLVLEKPITTVHLTSSIIRDNPKNIYAFVNIEGVSFKNKKSNFLKDDYSKDLRRVIMPLNDLKIDKGIHLRK